MARRLLLLLPVLLLIGAGQADEPKQDAAAAGAAAAVAKNETKATPSKQSKDSRDSKQSKEEKGDKLISGMSIVGNDEAPKSLVIVPWKSSELGQSLDFSKSQDDGRQPVDRDVFMRELHYYQIRTGAR